MGEGERARTAAESAALGAAESAVRAVAEEVEHADRPPAELPPPGAYLRREDGPNLPCPFPCSVCRRKGRQ